MPGYFFRDWSQLTYQNLTLTQPIECQQEIKMAAAELQEDPSLLYARVTRRIARDEFAGFFYDRHDIETVRKYRTTLNRITFG